MKYVGELHSFVSKGKDDGPPAGACNFLAVGDGDVTVGEGSVCEERLPRGAHVLGTPAVHTGVGAVRVGRLLDAAKVAAGKATSHSGVAQALWTS